MATIEGIIAEIKKINPAIDPISQEVIKNTVKMQGLCLRTNDTNIAPCIYVDAMLNSDISDDEAAAQIVAIYNQSGIDIDPAIFTDKEFILNNIYVGLQRKDDSCKYITRESEQWDSIIEYLYIRNKLEDGTSCSVKVTQQLLKQADIEENMAWDTAEKATCSEIKIESLVDVLAGLMGIDDIEQYAPPMYVISNSLRVNGAAVALNQEYIKEWARERGYKKLVLIFSSIHEALLLPADDSADLDTIATMMHDVNENEVDEVEQLADKAFIINM